MPVFNEGLANQLHAEVLFHRYLQTLTSGANRGHYRGRHDLNGLEPPEFSQMLGAVREALIDNLNDEKYVPEHVAHPPFHVDYVDSITSNAIAFRDEYYSYIGLTIPLIAKLWDVCDRLSHSEVIFRLLAVQLDASEHESLRAVLFRTVLFFVVAHEYTHHVHGHVALRESAGMFYNEIVDDGRPGALQDQALELDADGYAAYHVLANLIDGSARRFGVMWLKLGDFPPAPQDQVLLSCFVVAVGSYFFVRPAAVIDAVNVYGLSHPPQAVRMDSLMRQAIAWCQQNRPALVGWMTADRFRTMMGGVAEVIWGMNGGADWSQQTTFLQSPSGLEYLTRVDRARADHIKALYAAPVEPGGGHPNDGSRGG